MKSRSCAYFGTLNCKGETLHYCKVGRLFCDRGASIDCPYRTDDRHDYDNEDEEEEE